MTATPHEPTTETTVVITKSTATAIPPTPATTTMPMVPATLVKRPADAAAVTATPVTVMTAKVPLSAPAIVPVASASPKATAASGKTASDDPVAVTDPADATCVEFLHIMKAFSESSVNAHEMVQRVDTLLHQDEQLQRLLPLAPEKKHPVDADDEEMDEEHRSASVVDTTDDEGGSNSSRLSSTSGVSMAAGGCAGTDSQATVVCSEDLCMNKTHSDDDDGDMDDEVDLEDVDMELDVDLVDDEANEVNEIMLDLGGPRIPPLEALEGLVPVDHEQQAQEDLERWMELELDLDSTSDAYDAALPLPGATPTSGTQHGTTSLSSATIAATSASSSNLAAINAAAALGRQLGGPSHANSSSVLATTTASLAASVGAPRSRFRSLATASVFDKKAVTAALFDDDDDDDHPTVRPPISSVANHRRMLMTASLHAASANILKKKQSDDEDDEDDGDLVLQNSLARNKTLSKTTIGTKRSLEELKSDEEATVAMWGVDLDSYEQELWSSIDHAVLCDRENRFLQWDLEIEAATAAAAAAAAVQQQQRPELRTPPPSTPAGAAPSCTTSSARQKILQAPSPRDFKPSSTPSISVSRSPSNVDANVLAEDWSSLDFGTFQNRTVSHILSSCLHKRKLHHPYKDRVTLVNFNVPGGEPIGPPPPLSSHSTGALTTSLLFGGANHAAKNNPGVGVSGIAVHGVGDSDGYMRDENSRAAGNLAKSITKPGEKKPKKPREDKKRPLAATQKLHDAFADLDNPGDHDGDGRLPAKAPVVKLENLPLPDLTNLPQDLKELKRKIEATEHKVEGTKHRHRKGGPCPRCQVQNQLRAAKRAYHKRAVAHKKLPQLGGGVGPALTATAVQPPASTPVTSMIAPARPDSTISASSNLVTSVVIPATSMASVPVSATGSSAAAAVAAMKLAASSHLAGNTMPPAVPLNIVRPATTPVVPERVVAAVAPTSVAESSSAIAQVIARTVAPARPPVSAPSLTAVAVSSLTTPAPAAQLAVSASPPAPTPAASSFPRRPCGETAISAAFVASASTGSASSATQTSSPESTSSPPQVQQVTVTSA